MKRILSYVVWILSAALLWGCSKRAMGRMESGAKLPVQFSCEGFSKTGGAATRVTGENFEPGDVVGMFSYPSDGPMFGSGDFTKGNVPYVYMQAGELLVREGEVPLYFPDDPSVPLTFKGYYPYSEQMTADGLLTLDLADQRAGEKNAVLYSDNAQRIVRTANYVGLEFGYAMAQVIIRIQYDPDEMPGGDVAAVSAVTLEGDGIYSACDFHMADGSVTAAAGVPARGTIGMRPGSAETTATVAPATARDLTVSVTTPAHTYVARPRDITYERGRQYTYNVTLKGGGEAQIGEASIVDWEPGNDGIPPIIGVPEYEQR